MHTIRRPLANGLYWTRFGLVRMDQSGRLWTARSMTDVEAIAFRDSALSTYETRRHVINNVNTGGNLGYVYLVSGTPPSDPEAETFIWKHKPPNANFKKRQRNGEIIMGPMDVGEVSIQQHYGFADSQTSIRDATVPVTEFVNGFRHVDPSVPSIKYVLVHITGDLYVNINNKNFTFKQETLKRTPVLPNLQLSLDSLVDTCRSSIAIDSSIVTSCVSDANAHQMDALTFVAELPKTVFNVISGFKNVARAMKAARDKEFVVSRSFAKRKKLLQAQLEKDLAALRKLKSESAKNRKQIHQLTRMENLKKRTFRKAMEQTIADFNDALATIWMTFRYEIMPNVYSVEDALDAYANAYSDYQTSREKENFNFELEVLPDASLEITNLHRVVLKQRYEIDRENSARLASVLSANIATTAWELVKRSFVIDWFINVGDFLTATLGIDTSIQRVCCYSRKLDVHQKVVDPENSSAVTIKVNAYKRIVINPSDYLGLCFRPEMNLARYIDSVAMLWPTVKRLIIDSNKRKQK